MSTMEKTHSVSELIKVTKSLFGHQHFRQNLDTLHSAYPSQKKGGYYYVSACHTPNTQYLNCQLRLAPLTDCSFNR